jgi:predicted nucleic acid-binding protein
MSRIDIGRSSFILLILLSRKPPSWEEFFVALRNIDVPDDFLAEKDRSQEVHIRVDVLPWDGVIAECYGPVRAKVELSGKILAPMDLLIASHALTTDATLVTSDRAFRQVPGFAIRRLDGMTIGTGLKGKT